MQNTTLSPDLNRRIMQLAPKHDVSDLAPDTFTKLCSTSSRLVVWSGGSDNTIYGDSKVNYAFRAWHDSVHLKLHADFTFEGETRVALEQARLIGSDTLGDLIIAEVVGQAEYLKQYGIFPENQLNFVLQYLNRRK